MPRRPDTSPQTLQVLTVLLSDLEAWHYGYALSKQTRLASGTLYPILQRLAERGLLETRWQESDGMGRPPRHTYRLTGEGATYARQRLAEASGAPTAERLVPRAAT